MSFTPSTWSLCCRPVEPEHHWTGNVSNILFVVGGLFYFVPYKGYNRVSWILEFLKSVKQIPFIHKVNLLLSIQPVGISRHLSPKIPYFTDCKSLWSISSISQNMCKKKKSINKLHHKCRTITMKKVWLLVLKMGS